MSAQEVAPDLKKSQDQPTESEQETYKKQLDRVADEARAQEQSPKPNPVVEKITEYVPGAAKLLGQQSPPNESNRPETTGPPHRPDHDHKIEDFVRDQHRSKGKDGLLGSGD